MPAEYVPTDAQRALVENVAAFGINQADIADQLNIDEKTLRKHFREELNSAMHETPFRGKHVVVQRYGETNRELQAELESEGADVTEIMTYRWGLPEDTASLLRLIGASISWRSPARRRRATFSPSHNTLAKRRRLNKVLTERSLLYRPGMQRRAP
jgi:AraC-like DNA-binding protein